MVAIGLDALCNKVGGVFYVESIEGGVEGFCTVAGLKLVPQGGKDFFGEKIGKLFGKKMRNGIEAAFAVVELVV